MSEWQTIDMAPKDGSVVLLYQPFGQWRGNRSGQQIITTGYWHQPGNPTVAGFWCSAVTFIYRPTHWMPLPDPPKER